ncbi:hypothetical protein FRACA_50067 [Frankia canadensis]|uniref:Uncharacterized protein n=1 Tax=Frankia canadensis TaxID=1836972 RepID=A0A2I2KYE8_9ACTN|nr:hypothetical protein FRACA_50067 [Frankia canadensis]SOU57969.1 hypothetical protein FRACA_50067 [Frankia canadensis]
MREVRGYPTRTDDLRGWGFVVWFARVRTARGGAVVVGGARRRHRPGRVGSGRGGGQRRPGGTAVAMVGPARKRRAAGWTGTD